MVDNKLSQNTSQFPIDAKNTSKYYIGKSFNPTESHREEKKIWTRGKKTSCNFFAHLELVNDFFFFFGVFSYELC